MGPSETEIILSSQFLGLWGVQLWDCLYVVLIPFTGMWTCAHRKPIRYCPSLVHAFPSGSTGQVFSNPPLLPQYMGWGSWAHPKGSSNHPQPLQGQVGSPRRFLVNAGVCFSPSPLYFQDFFSVLYSWSLLFPSRGHPSVWCFLSYLTTEDDHLPAWPTHRQGPRDGFRGGTKEKHTIPVLLQRTCIFQCFKQHTHWTDSQVAIPLQRLVLFPPWGRSRTYRYQAPHPREGSTPPRHSWRSLNENVMHKPSQDRGTHLSV